LMYVDQGLYLPDDVLVKVDRMSMRSSLEVRAPFLDPEVLELSGQIPLAMKIRGKVQKYLLKKVALRYLPAEIVYRKKHGFVVPMAQWINRAGADEIRTRITSFAATKPVEALIKSHFDRGIDLSHKLFALIVLGCYQI
jgi:asparagine synthase (glutamine-hydrolysing)